MRHVVLRNERHDGDIHTFTVSDGWGETIVLTEGASYRAVGRESAREVDTSVVVRGDELHALALALGVASRVPVDLVVPLSRALEVARVMSIDAAARWLDARGVGYERTSWYTH